jgi:hypothetical protein
LTYEPILGGEENYVTILAKKVPGLGFSKHNAWREVVLLWLSLFDIAYSINSKVFLSKDPISSRLHLSHHPPVDLFDDRTIVNDNPCQLLKLRRP